MSIDNPGEPIDCSCMGMNESCSKCEGKGYYYDRVLKGNLEIIPVSIKKKNFDLKDHSDEFASEAQMKFIEGVKYSKSKSKIYKRRKPNKNSSSKKSAAEKQNYNPENGHARKKSSKLKHRKNASKNKSKKHTPKNKFNQTWSAEQLEALNSLKREL